MNISESNENSSSRLSEMQSSTELPTSERRPISRPVVPGNLPQNWKPGQSGNPAGRPKGVKNQITILKEALELKLRNKAAYKIEKVLDKAVELALLGDRIMIKLLLELHMSKAAHQEDTAARASQVAVVIQNLTDKGSATVSDVIDVTSQIKVSKDE
jgi:hypothetical protein